MTANEVDSIQPADSTVVVAADGSVTVTQVSNAVTVTYPGVLVPPVAPTVPAQVGTVTPTAGDQQVGLAWSAPADGGSPITDYSVQYSTDDATWSTFAHGTTATTATVTGLTNGTLYYFRVAAINAVGTGAYSASVTATPVTVPAQVGTVTPTAGDQQVGLAWSAPDDGGSAITDYSVQYSTDDATWSTFAHGTTATTATVTGLTNGTLYYFRVAAINAVGTGTYSASVTATPVTVPAQVGTVTPTAGDQQVGLAWSAPADGGSAITDYSVQYSTDDATWSTFAHGTTATTATVTGLTNGTLYYFRVAAINAVGTGTYSASVTATPATVPAQVGTVTPTAGDEQVGLSWSAPADGGSPITDYSVQYSTDDATWSTFAHGTTATTSTVTGLTNGTLYYFRVAAINAVGTGAYSASVTATPAGFSPLDLSPTLWLDASDTSTITESSGKVSQWDDKSGNNNHVTQGTASQQPTTGTRTINSLNVLDYDLDVLVKNGLGLTQPYTIFAVVEMDAVSTRFQGIVSDTGFTTWRFNVISTTLYAYAGANLSTGTLAAAQPFIARGVFNSTSSEVAIDGSAVTGNAGTFEASNTAIGYASNNRQWDGVIAEVIIVDDTLTAQQKSDTETYLANKWGITL